MGKRFFKGNIFDVDFTNLDAVKLAAKQMSTGKGDVLVVKYPRRDNYNISSQWVTDRDNPAMGPIEVLARY